jgi:hypothetical protein
MPKYIITTRIRVYAKAGSVRQGGVCTPRRGLYAKAGSYQPPVVMILHQVCGKDEFCPVFVITGGPNNSSWGVITTLMGLGL